MRFMHWSRVALPSEVCAPPVAVRALLLLAAPYDLLFLEVVAPEHCALDFAKFSKCCVGRYTTYHT